MVGEEWHGVYPLGWYMPFEARCPAANGHRLWITRGVREWAVIARRCAYRCCAFIARRWPAFFAGHGRAGFGPACFPHAAPRPAWRGVRRRKPRGARRPQAGIQAERGAIAERAADAARLRSDSDEPA
jgi:hypothetical protein